MKYLKITFVIVGFLTFSQSYAQDIKPGIINKFEKIDINDDSALSLEEVTAFFEGKTTNKGNPIKPKRMFANKDTNEDGQLSLEEFAAKPKNKLEKKKK